MKVTICDFCKTEIKKNGIEFIYAGAKHRIIIQGVKIQHGVRWKDADVCPKCIENSIKNGNKNAK